MDLISLIFLSCALAMDSFAISLCKGFSVKNLQIKHYILTSFYFGGFQALMPAIGYIMGVSFEPFVRPIDHWIAFILLSFLGIKMIKEGFENENCPNVLNVNLILALFLIGFITSILCVLALKIGNSFGIYFKNKAEFLGGAVLILIGIKILIEHLYFD